MPVAKWPPTQTQQIEHWGDLRSDLSSSLRILQEREKRFLILARKNSNRYVRFASVGDGWILGQAVSNKFLDDSEKLTSTSCGDLIRLGWNAPNTSASSNGNYWKKWPSPAPISEVVTLAVRTLREAFRVTPTELDFVCDSFYGGSLSTFSETGGWVAPERDINLKLRYGQVVQNPLNRRRYRVRERLGCGGFGAVYRVDEEPCDEPLPAPLCLKVTVRPEAWHREAYFGELLRGVERTIQTYDSFAWIQRGKNTVPIYCLVSELATGSDLSGFLEEHPKPWTEAKARREIVALLRAVRLLHAGGAVHRDITPKNVFLTSNGVLKLGDFGIASHRIGDRDVKANVFNWLFAPSSIRDNGGFWRPADDVYSLGQLFGMLLLGDGSANLGTEDVKKLDCSPATKAIIQRCIGERRKRFMDADEMLRALEKQDRGEIVRSRISSLKGKRVVLTGRLSIKRSEAARLVKRSGGVVGTKVTQDTDVVVVGNDSPHWLADNKGRKLLDVDREGERGHRIAVLNEKRFLALVRVRK